MNYRSAVHMQFLVWRDAVANLAPHMDRQGLYWCITQLRAEPGSGGLWCGLPEPLAGQRDAFRYMLVEYAEKVGDPWPFPLDGPMVPDDASALLG